MGMAAFEERMREAQRRAPADKDGKPIVSIRDATAYPCNSSATLKLDE